MATDAIRTTGGRGVAVGEQEPILRDDRREISLLVAGENLSITQAVYAAGERVASPHVHHGHTDAFYVLEGELTFEIGAESETVTIGAGGFVAAPPGVAHSFRAGGTRPARWLTLHAHDGGYADFMRGIRDHVQVDWDIAPVPRGGGLPARHAIVSSPADDAPPSEERRSRAGSLAERGRPLALQRVTLPSVTEQLIEVGAIHHPVVLPRAERERLQRRARLLAWGGIAWHFVEFAIAIAAGLVAGSIALIGFGADSLIEALAGFVVLWLFTGARLGSESAERRAQQLIAVSFVALAAYVGVESVRTLLEGRHPDVSWIGIGLAAFTAVTMPLLAYAKRDVGKRLRSSATVKEASQTTLCAYLSIALLVGLLANALVGWWWADPLAALVIAGVAVREGRESWRGQGCCDAC